MPPEIILHGRNIDMPATPEVIWKALASAKAA
jgi:hypothetical protein